MLTTSDLHQIKGLCEYLNKAFNLDHELSVDVALTDSNGDTVGKVYFTTDVGEGEHVFQAL